jgi:sugar lactone lactonase YvrE
MRRTLRILLAFSAVLAAYLSFWPVPVAPVRWQVAASPGYVGAHAPNNELGGLRRIALDGERGPEHLALGPEGKLYATVLSGWILRMNPDGSALERFAHTDGRALGFDFDRAGNLIVADAVRGLLSVAPDKTVTLLADRVDGTPIRYADAVIVAPDGTIYLSDASMRFDPPGYGGTFEASILDIIEQSATGRIIAFDPATRTTRIVAQGLSFANGVVLTADATQLLVVETGRYRIWKIATTANAIDLRSSPPEASILLDNLPGYPDNLMRGLDGRIWVGLTKPRSAVVDWMADKPFLRTLTLRLPRALWPVPRPYGHVIAFTESGEIVADLQDPSGAYPETTSAVETRERLYVQSLHADAIGWLAR